MATTNYSNWSAAAGSKLPGSAWGAGSSGGDGQTSYDLFRLNFADWGLSETLLVWAYNRYKELGADEQAANRVAEEMKSRPEFKARFPAFDELAKRGEAISIDEYLAYEQAVRKSMKAFGVDPEMFGTDSKIADMLTNRVSADEARSRMEMASYAAYTAPPEVKAAMATRYGVTEGDLVAFWLEPDEAMPVLQRKFGTSQIMGALAEQGIKGQDANADSAYERGYTYASAREAAARARGLQGVTAGEDVATQDDVVAAQFGDQAAALRLERAVAARRARFEAGGGAASGQTGLSGLGESSAR
jgi:hypothetical protein